MAEHSPMIKQYLSIKEQHKDSILFFRLGDFYEMFFDDAELVSKELEIALTERGCGQGEKAPMCGIPYHSCEAYIARLISKGYKIAMCDQVGDPSKSRGLVDREVVRVITPGTVIEPNMLDESKNNYICSIFVEDNSSGICFCDVSTGELKLAELYGSDIVRQIQNELGRFCPKEVLIGGKIALLDSLKSFMKDKLCCNVEFLNQECFDLEASIDKFNKHFGDNKVRSDNICKKKFVLRAIGALIFYLEMTQEAGLERINRIKLYNDSEYMGLDLNTIRNLELVETMRSKDKKGSLLWVLDQTKTAMGKRLLRSWVERPLVNSDKIVKRQDAISEIYNDAILRDELADILCGIYDIERLMTRITYSSANARDLKALASVIPRIPKLKKVIEGKLSTILLYIYENIDDLEDIFKLIDEAIVDEPPFSVKEGGIIKKGYSEEIDKVKNDMNGGKDIIASIEAKEKSKTGIQKLKVGYNKISGYYIEVTNSYKKLVPDEYIRKQTLTNCERYTTSELKEIEGRILGARERAAQLEYEAFEKIREKVANNLRRISNSANLIALIDVLRSLADVASKNDFKKPKISLNDKILIKDGRHPVIETLLINESFVPNDIVLDNRENMIAIITGPNMAGKSTYMRQVALIVLMAQIGSFVPASYAEIGIVDSIFTRIGASDDLASGQSTFMVEMNEVAQIVKNATDKSLLILDEIGRGTSTFDGMSIARAVLEYVADKSKLGSKTLFATHYHELTSVSSICKGVKNYNIAVKKIGDNITFLRKIVPGGADDSYGIQVAKLAGIPEWIISRAKEVLREIENVEKCLSFDQQKSNDKLDSKEEIDPYKKFESYNEIYAAQKIVEKLKETDVNMINPMEAINILFSLVNMVKS